MKASIVVRTFNSERTIRRVLEAVSAQSLEDYEVVVVDSGSTDGTLKIVRQYPHTFVDYSGEKFTYSGSLNAGCAVARSEYVVCLSSHCVPLSGEWLVSLVGAMEAEGDLAGAWGPLYFDAGDYLAERREIKVMDLDGFYRRPNQGLQNSNSIIRRGLWEERPFSEEIPTCEDQEWAHHFLKRGYGTAMVGGAAVLYEAPHTPFRYGRKVYREFLVLNELFGCRPGGSRFGLLRSLTRLFGAVVLGRRSLQDSAIVLSGMVGMWLASMVVRFRGLSGSKKVSRRA